MRVVIYGSRPDGHAKVIAELLGRLGTLEPVGLVDDFPEHAGRRVGKLEILGRAADLPRLMAEGLEGAVLGFGENVGRTAALARLRDAGLALPPVVDSTAFVALSASLGDGCQILPGAHVGPDAVIGSGSLINTRAVVEHDVRVGEGAVVGPGAVLTGRVAVDREAMIGAGAVLLPDTYVGPAVTIGAGAVVTRDVRSGTAVGVPARQR